MGIMMTIFIILYQCRFYAFCLPGFDKAREYAESAQSFAVN